MGLSRRPKVCGNTQSFHTQGAVVICRIPGPESPGRTREGGGPSLSLAQEIVVDGGFVQLDRMLRGGAEVRMPLFSLHRIHSVARDREIVYTRKRRCNVKSLGLQLRNLRAHG